MSNRHIKGRNLEYFVRERLRALGYAVFRCAGSRPVDLIAIRNGTILLLECKAGTNPYLSPKQANYILEISKIVGATPFLVVRKKHREMKWFKMTEQGVEETGLKRLEQGSL